MSDASEDKSNELVCVARAVRARGLKGEIVAELLTDFPERFDVIDKLVAVAPDGQRREVQLEDHWFQNDRVILKLVGCDNVDTAKTFVGYDFAVPEAERVQLSEDEYYDWELEGCTVQIEPDKKIGTVRSVLKTGGVEILLVVDDNQKEKLVPLVSSIVIDVDLRAKVILIDPPEGLFDL
jgi:16S rRNA processing protein RimM